MADLIGQTIGHYRIESLVGTGGMGQVFRGVHVHLGRQAAIKIMHAHLAIDPGFQARFVQEAQAAAALSHPNIIQVYDFGEQDGRFYLVMELVGEGSVKRILERRRRGDARWTLRQTLELARQGALGLAYAHRRGMAHRDIKPDNLLLQSKQTDSGEFVAGEFVLKICDFGLARLTETPSHTTAGAMLGTPAYMSPEQCQGQPIDTRTDQYSFGIVLYEAVTGHLPFTPSSPSDAIFKHVHTPPPSIREAFPELPEDLDQLILRCLAKKPEQRFATMDALVEALDELLGRPDLDSPALAPQPSEETAHGRDMLALVGMQVGRFQIEAAISSGTVAWVYRGRHISLQRPTVLKVLRPELARDSPFVQRFLREARLAARLRHPGIVEIYDVAAASGLFYIAMALVEGQTLRQFIDGGRATVPETLSIAQQLADALDHAHLHGVVHGDVKPSNVLVRPDGSVVLVDFGIARAVESLSQPGDTPASVYSVLGSSAYLSPEQAGHGALSPRTDVYALGCVVYELLAGQPPFAGGSFEALVDAHLHAVPVPVHEHVAGLEPAVSAVVARALAKDPSARHATVSEFVGALANAVDTTADVGLAADASLPQVPDAAAHVTEPGWSASGSGAGGAIETAIAKTAPGEPAGGQRRTNWTPGVVLVLVLGIALGGLYVLLRDGDGNEPPPATLGAGAAATATALGQIGIPASPSATATSPATNAPTLTAVIATAPPTATATATTAPTATVPPTATPSPTVAVTPTFDWPAAVRQGLIAFVSGRRENNPNIPDIYIMNPDGSEQRRLLTFEAADAYPSSDPAWSPDGSRMAFKSSRDGNDEIYVMDIDGSNLANLTESSWAEELPVWSPDGARIAYQSLRDGNWDIFVMDADGANVTPLTSNPATDWGPDWQPDGNQILFVSDRDGNSEIYVMNADGSDPRNLTNAVEQDYHPAWSPDGTRIAFSRQLGDNWELFVMNADGSGVQRLTDSPAEDSTPTWSPDGQQILFRSFRDGNPEVYVMNSDGSDPRRLTNNPTYDGSPVWSPS